MLNMKRILLLSFIPLIIACSSESKNADNSDSTVLKSADTTELNIVGDTSLTDNSESTITVSSDKTEIKEVEPKSNEVDNTQKTDFKTATVVKTVEDPDLAKIKNGELLISKSDCFACHKIQDKLLGPSYKEIANKYAKNKTNIDYLVNKVKVGGSGVWGAVPMSPHPNLSDDDARDMILYILSLK